MNTERYLTPLEVEKFTGRKAQTLANERFRGVGIPYYKIGSSVRYKLSEVISFMEKHRINPETRLCSANGAGEVEPQSLNQTGQ